MVWAKLIIIFFMRTQISNITGKKISVFEVTSDKTTHTPVSLKDVRFAYIFLCTVFYMYK